MSKRILVMAAALTGAAVIALAGVNIFLRRNPDYLVRQAEQALGRRISAERVQVTFWPLGARMSHLSVAGAGDRSGENFLSADEMRVELRLLPLFTGRFRPRKIALKSPRIDIVRDAAGGYNFTRDDRRSEKLQEPGEEHDAAGSAARPEKLFSWIPSLQISDGALRYRDLRSGSELRVSRINLKASDFEPGATLDIELEAAVAADKPNLHFKSRFGPMAGHRDYRDIPLDGEINAYGLDLGKINQALPQFRRALPRALRFDGIYMIRELKFQGTLNHLTLKGAVTGSDGSFRFE